MIILDTHVLAWIDNDEHRLGRKAKAVIDRVWKSGKVAVSALSFWEAALLQNRLRIKLPEHVDEWRNQLLRAGLIEFPLNGAISIRAADLNALPSDPADRFIVATALHHHAELMTADDKLLAWNHPLVRHDARV